MADLQGFLSAAHQVANNPCLVLRDQTAGQQDSSSVRTSRRARWVQRFHTKENRAVSSQFLASLETSYGDESARAAARCSGLNHTLARGKPLRARQVTAAVEAAKFQSANTRDDNRRLAHCYEQSLRREGTDHLVASSVIKNVARRHANAPDSISRLLDRRQLAPQVSKAILAAGENGEYGFQPVTREQADEICRRIVEQELRDAFDSAFHRARGRALKALNPQMPDTIAHHELRRVCDRLEPPIDLGCNVLSADAAEFFARQVALAIDTGAIHFKDLADEASLRDLASSTAEQFVEERRAARDEVAKLRYLDPEVQEALRVHVTRDTIPRNIVTHLGETYFLVANHLDALAGPLPPNGLEESIKTIRETLTSSWTAAGVNIDQDNEELYYRYAWRFLLAPGGAAQASAILARLAPDDSLLRGIGESAYWYADEFKGTEQAAKTFTDEESGLSRNVHDQVSFDNAHDYSLLMQSLRSTLLEITGRQITGGAMLEQNPHPTDQTVATLRNLGIPFPAPERLNCFNNDVPLSNSTLAQMRRELDRQVRGSRRIHRSGLTQNCRVFLRANEMTVRGEFKARFTIDGKQLPVKAKAETVARELREFCRDREGTLNLELLANISRVVHVATFRSLYHGCMNPDRPDLSIMNGYPEGAFAGHAYSLRKNDDGDVLLEVSERITPLMHYPMHQNDVRPASGAQPGDAAPKGVRLSGRHSDFLTRASIHFNPASFKPQLHSVNISYWLEQGDARAEEPPFWIRRPDVPEAPQSADDMRRGQQYAHVVSVEEPHSRTPDSASTHSGGNHYEEIGPPTTVRSPQANTGNQP